MGRHLYRGAAFFSTVSSVRWTCNQQHVGNGTIQAHAHTRAARN